MNFSNHEESFSNKWNNIISRCHVGKNRAMADEEIERIKVLAATASLEHSTYNRVK
jgi:hypothetical protein